ncbi:DUF4132 domain-containing protein [Shewanella sp. A3A]|nr:DUF4132 domain-containing protein [Shewanella ferrihydritica]
MLKTFTSKLFGKSTASDLDTLLTTACKGYDAIQKGLASKVAHYLSRGEGAECLNALGQLTSGRGSNMPGQYAPDNAYSPDKNILAAMQQAFADELTHQPAFLHRMGLVNQALGIRVYFRHLESIIDGWFAYLLVFLNEHMEAVNDEAAIATLPNRQELLAALREFELPEWYIDAYILERTHWRYGDDYANYLLKQTDWPAICAEPDYYQQLTQLHAEGRNTLCNALTEQAQLSSDLLPLLLQLAADKSNKVRKSALGALNRIDETTRLNYLTEHFPEANSATRGYWVAVAADGEQALPLLEAWLAVEKVASVKKLLGQAIEQCQLKQQSENFSWELPSYSAVAFDKTFQPHWLDDCMQAVQQLIAESEADIKNTERAAAGSYWAEQLDRYQDRLKLYKTITRSQVAQWLQQLADGQTPSSTIIYAIINQAKLLQQPNVQLAHFFMLVPEQNRWLYSLLNSDSPSKLIQDSISDVRQLLPLLQEFGYPATALTNQLLNLHGNPTGVLPPALEALPLWPLFAEYPQTMEYALEGQLTAESQTQAKSTPLILDRLNNNNNYDETSVTAQALFLLADFPKVPAHWLQRVYQLAFDGRKQVRQQAQLTAEQHGIITDKVTEGLQSSSKETRGIAAQWLIKLQLSDAQTALQQAIKKEKDLATRAQLLAALQLSGGDISEFTSPEALASEAAQGLKKAPPKSMAWLQQSALPACQFANGEPAAPSTIYWWCVLAVKLNQPAGNNLLRLYLSLLDTASQAQLAHFLLSAFISQDTRGPSDQEAHEYAEANKQNEFAMYQRWAQYEWGSDYQKRTLEDAYNACFQTRKKQLFGSAIKEKGLLALIAGGKPNELLALLQPFMKQHYVRRAQIEALISAVASIDDPVTIQFVLSIARRYRTASVQELARQLVDQIATRNHWTTDELADRTIQTAGFENTQGPTPFSYGKRTLSLQLSDDLKFQLLNEDGKELKALPQPRKDDDEESVKETKKWFSSCKKELKQIIEQQSARLYEAMATERHWPASDWQEYLHQHPVMFRLLQRTLWQVELADGWHSFRPTEDGALIDIDDEELELPATANIRLVSGNQLDSTSAKAWQAHLKDYKIKPLFEQLKHVAVTLTPEQTTLDHHHGLLTDAYTLRGLLTKKDYKQGQPEDAGFFDHYLKSFDNLGLRVILSFSGNCVPEENVTAAIYHISVLKIIPNARGWQRYQTLPLNQVPANLLNAIALDYEDVAKKCHADPEWEKKLPW